jgi:hypothetical protein
MSCRPAGQLAAIIIAGGQLVPRLDDTQRLALAQWWDLAQSAANGGYRVTDMISAASDIAGQGLRQMNFAIGQALSTLYGYARRMFNAAGVFQSAPVNAVITPDMMATPPWARDQVVMDTTPIWHVNFDFTYLDANGNIRTDTRTSIFEMTFPETIGDLMDALQSDAEAMAAKYGVTLVDISPLRILTV